MSAANHTPGPWVIRRALGTPGSIVGGVMRTYSNGMAQDQLVMVASVQPDNGGSEAMEANARLIAAAPELLEALQDVLREAVILSDDYLSAFESLPKEATIQGWDKGRWLAAAAAAKKARCAIAKATGGAS